MLKRRMLVWLVLVMLLAAALACGSDTTTDGESSTFVEDTLTEEPTEVAVIEAGVEDSSGVLVNLEIINQMESTDLCYLFIAPMEDEEFGDERLGDDVIVAAGESYVVEGIPAGEYKLKIHDCDGNFVNALYGVAMDQEEMTWTIKEATLIVANDSSLQMCELYVSPNSAPESAWGPNQIENEPLESGQQVSFFLAEGAWDIRAVPCDEGVESVIELGVEVEGEITWTISDISE